MKIVAPYPPPYPPLYTPSLLPPLHPLSTLNIYALKKRCLTRFIYVLNYNYIVHKFSIICLKISQLFSWVQKVINWIGYYSKKAPWLDSQQSPWLDSHQASRLNSQWAGADTGGAVVLSPPPLRFRGKKCSQFDKSYVFFNFKLFDYFLFIGNIMIKGQKKYFSSLLKINITNDVSIRRQCVFVLLVLIWQQYDNK